MDNLTHSLAGALIGQTGLKRRTGLAMPALVIGANLPDIDAVAAFAGSQGLAIRRGLTHGPLAMLLLPLALTGAMLLWARWRASPQSDDRRPAVRAGALLALAVLAVWSHPALDWLNSYGVRLLEPFSSSWCAGDTLFIIDPWLWFALLLSLILSRQRERRGEAGWRRPALAGLAAILAYIGCNWVISTRAEALAGEALAARGQPARSKPSWLVVANPVPLRFWRRDMLWRDRLRHGRGRFDLIGGLALEPGSAPNRLDHPLLAVAARREPRVRAFLFWSRMPVVVDGPDGPVLTDQRFASLRWGAARRGAGGLRAPFAIPLVPSGR